MAVSGIEGFTAGLGEPIALRSAALSLLLAFGLTQAIAAVYVWTFRGMSYSQGLVHSIVLGSIIACTLMLAIGGSIAAGLGIAGGLAIVRFRTALRDPRDMMFVFAGLGAGIAAGLGAHAAALCGAALFCFAVGSLTWIEFGSTHRLDGLLRFQLPADADEAAVMALLRRYTRFVALVTLREVAQGAALEHAYHVRFADPRRRVALVQAIEALPGAQDVSLLLQEPTVEL
ncbi:DUF4956 domain-containing protein [Nannocystis pusilla]|uniref:DUF4956 domain-containing protein n=1 Tax=Nannocystis pusilla TaxID=889268 RepID=A0A9X3IZ04_9BACT|nr:DUF4956 domain-containing protein [Nannocystis pusilla]